ncbi:transposase [Photobacterium sanguinicancri]|uniref:transposase n=2 Tax=Gammaproteobacteria TaxID=1236 RepID=UPI0026E21F12|nr:transposase [Photobacterium sanguinicancri]MDO6496959.1 transposase [Photobacterium sanguinicancri]
MPAYKTGKKTPQYSLEFKLKAMQWSFETHRTVKSVAEALDIHPFMLSKWRKTYKDEVMQMVKNKDLAKPKKLKQNDELESLKQRIAELEEENDILKKWQRYQVEQRRKGSDS